MRSIYFFMGVGVMGIQRLATHLTEPEKEGTQAVCDTLSHSETSCLEANCGMKDVEGVKNDDCDACATHNKDTKCDEYEGCETGGIGVDGVKPDPNNPKCYSCRAIDGASTERCRAAKCGMRAQWKGADKFSPECEDCDIADGPGGEAKCEDIVGCNYNEQQDSGLAGKGDCQACTDHDDQEKVCKDDECGWKKNDTDKKKGKCIDCDVFDGTDDNTCEDARGCAFIPSSKDCESVVEECNPKRGGTEASCQALCAELDTQEECDGASGYCEMIAVAADADAKKQDADADAKQCRMKPQ